MKSTSGSKVHPVFEKPLLWDFLQMTSDGVPQKQIALKLGLNKRTLHETSREVRDLFQANSLPQAVKRAERQGVLR
jgi:DNA-binding CsgD family transcriptional regulator